MSDYEPTHEKRLQSLALHTIYTALGGMHVSGYEGAPTTVMDDMASVRQTQRYVEPDGTRYVYTINTTVSVSKVELP